MKALCKWYCAGTGPSNSKAKPERASAKSGIPLKIRDCCNFLHLSLGNTDLLRENTLPAQEQLGTAEKMWTLGLNLGSAADGCTKPGDVRQLTLPLNRDKDPCLAGYL